MTTLSRWVVPSYFAELNHQTDEITFDLTDHLKLMLKNEVWERKIEYGFRLGLKNTNPDEIVSAKIKIFPSFFSGQVNLNRIPELVEKVCGRIPSYLKIKNYTEWSHLNGFVIIEIEYNIKTKKHSI